MVVRSLGVLSNQLSVQIIQIRVHLLHLGHVTQNARILCLDHKGLHQVARISNVSRETQTHSVEFIDLDQHVSELVHLVWEVDCALEIGNLS